jgi:hypothetical protein
MGACIAFSKSMYIEAHPNDQVLFNANVCTEKLGVVWWGDLNVTQKRKELQECADLLNARIYVLREFDAKYENEKCPRLERAVVVLVPREQT